MRRSYIVRWAASSLFTLLAACGGSTAPASTDPVGSSASFAFQPIAIQRIDLPASVVSAGWPVFANDGQHLLFFSTGTSSTGGNTGQGTTAELWITGLDGGGAHCLSCGLVNDPTSKGEGEITPFPDGKRVFFGSFNQPGSSQYGVLECSPSVADCRSASILPVDFSAAEPKLIPPGGVVLIPQLNTGGAYAAKLSQDGVHVGFSDILIDSIEMMVVGTLTRSSSGYQVTDPLVINPDNPTSLADTNIEAWSNGGALYEFKTFSNGGADATYAQSGGIALGNPDVWSVNLASGKRTRLTAHPDYDEDNAVSPNGKLLALWSNRTMHLTDWYGGLVPVRDFIDVPSALLALGISSSNKRCHGPIWIMPSGGDRDGTLAGQPIVYHPTPDIFVTNNLVGWPQWSADGTMLALNTTNSAAGSAYPAHAPFLLVAHFTAMQASPALAAVSSQPGAWAIPPADYHPAMGSIGIHTFSGPGGGTVTVSYLGNVLAGNWSETYKNYSDDGVDFVTGSVTITSAIEFGTYSSHLSMTGAHTGSTNTDMRFVGGAQGHGESTYDGNTVSGPSAEQTGGGACPDLEPKAPALQLAYSSLGNGAYRIHVTASVAGVGPNEASVDTEPVYHATLQLGDQTAYTDDQGAATVTVTSSHDLAVKAGDTLQAASIHLP
ncbi:TolB family protein [Nevskia soli]|uniref:TolB family protein n=1 Tax=Nevskia soli TaxID=418856 RepID=UPI0004A6F44F|nr:PD40 domain-containing protein [Nevskia soli]